MVKVNEAREFDEIVNGTLNDLRTFVEDTQRVRYFMHVLLN